MASCDSIPHQSHDGLLGTGAQVGGAVPQWALVAVLTGDPSRSPQITHKFQ